MIAWMEEVNNQSLGIWLLGIVLFAIQEIPYMVMPLFKLKKNPIMNMKESSVILDSIEKILGLICVLYMIFIVNNDLPFFEIGTGLTLVGFIGMITVLVLNFIGWALYFTGHQSKFIMMFFIVMMPPLYYMFIGIWRSNWILAIIAIIFLIVHTIHVYKNLKNEN